ncbi:hypothetical protein CRUP_003156 [Coryphaenoides rupestris]|nr:hypothetical protein CRUP_003156 [Coryphaenoides rupestris]
MTRSLRLFSPANAYGLDGAPEFLHFAFARGCPLGAAVLKKIQEKKKQLRERTELEIAARLAALGPIAEPSNMLMEEQDEDMLFE